MCRLARPAYVLLLAALPLPAVAAEGGWEATAAVGFGLYHPATYTAPAGTAEAGIGPRYILNAVGGRNFGSRFMLEAGWMFQDGDFELHANGTKTAFDAHAHSVYVNFVGYLLKRPTRWRPFVEGGSGVKFYTGQEAEHPRPLDQYGMFRDGTDARPLLTYGGGIKYTLSPRWSLRLDLRDVTTPFPTSVIVPAPGSNLHGWLHDFATTLGITFR
jgi:hypothetical protein